MVQLVKDLVLSLQPMGSLLWPGLDPWPGNFQTSICCGYSRKKRERRKRKGRQMDIPDLSLKRGVGSSLVAQQVKDLTLSLLWLGFDPWPRELPRAVGMAINK